MKAAQLRDAIKCYMKPLRKDRRLAFDTSIRISCFVLHARRAGDRSLLHSHRRPLGLACSGLAALGRDLAAPMLTLGLSQEEIALGQRSSVSSLIIASAALSVSVLSRTNVSPPALLMRS